MNIFNLQLILFETKFTVILLIYMDLYTLIRSLELHKRLSLNYKDLQVSLLI